MPTTTHTRTGLVAVIACDGRDMAGFYLVPTGREGIDTDRLEELGWNMAGSLVHAEQAADMAKFSDVDACELDDDVEAGQTGEDGKPIYSGPCFTECSTAGCDRLIMIDPATGGAPENCNACEPGQY